MRIGLKFICLLALVCLYSCQKDKLEGDKEILIGTWTWAFSVEESYFPTQTSDLYHDTIFSSALEECYQIEFLEKGKIKKIIDGDVEDVSRITFDFFRPNPVSDDLLFNAQKIGITLENNDDFTYASGLCVKDTLLIENYVGLPYEEHTRSDGLVLKYNHFFKKSD